MAEPSPAATVGPEAPAPAVEHVTGATRGRSQPRPASRRRMATARVPWLLLIGGVLLLAIIAAAVAAPVLTHYDPAAQSARERLQGPSATHLFGTDEFGRDVFSRVLYGGRTSLAASGAALVLTLAVGIPLGLLAGYAGGWADAAVMRLLDVLLAFPSFLLALVVAGLYGPGLYRVLAAVAVVWWVDYARLVRAMVLQAKTEEYVLAAHAMGAGPLRIAVLAVLPQVLGPVIVLAALDLGALLLAISALSFLGLGAQPPTPEWGVMLAEGRRSFLEHQHLMIFPGAAIFLAALAFSLLGEGARDLLDPRGAARPA